MMKNILIVFFVMCNTFVAFSQVQVARNIKKYSPTVIDISADLPDFNPILYVQKEARKPASDMGNKKQILAQQKNNFHQSAKSSARALTANLPTIATGFLANTNNGTPSDNSMAISNDGKIVSVVNTNLRVYDEAGTQLLFKNLSSFASALGTLGRISDPRVVYDPVADRFIVLFFNGVASNDTRIILAFSKNNNPVTGGWNFYQLSGNYLNDTTWSDYPILSLSDKDLFFTFNHLKDSLDWKDGFRYSAIWQLDKQRGYDGDTLQFNFWHNVTHQNKAIWSICPVQGGDFPTGNASYFLSVRPSDLDNDTVFLHTITDSYQSGNAQFSTKVLKTNNSYGLAPNAYQPNGQQLATNDARVLSAVFQNDQIHFVQNCIDPLTLNAGIYSGTIKNVSTTPVATGEVIGFDSINLGYPSICYIGNNAYENRFLINCSYIQDNSYPSVGAIYKDNDGNHSPLLKIKEGISSVNVLTDSTERWGDYSGIQRKYNEPNTAWLAAAYGSSSTYRTYIAKLVNTDTTVLNTINPIEQNATVQLYPNPVEERIELDFENSKIQQLYFDIYAMDGKKIVNLMQAPTKKGLLHFSFLINDLPKGNYLLQISSAEKTIATKRFVKK